MAQGNPLPGELYLHFKNKLYQVVAVAYHSETMERYVVYQALYGDFRTYVRPYEMFVSKVDHNKYPEVKQQFRFQYVDNIAYQTQKSAEEQQNNRNQEPAEEQQNNRNQEPAEEQQNNRNRESAEEQQNNRNQKSAEERQSNGNQEPAKNQEFSGAAKQGNEELESINPWLSRFLDAEDFHEKYKIVCDMHEDVTDRLIDDIAVVMDIVIPEGKLSERYSQLKYCIRTKQRYEMNRFR